MNDDEWQEELYTRFKHSQAKRSSYAKDSSLRQQYTNPEASYYNPDAWSRLIGDSNTATTYINGEAVKTLLDTGAQISFMSERYAERRGFEVHPLEKLVNFTGANGLGIDYSGYVEVNLQLPAKGFSQDVLVLVVPHIDYHNFVPITLGTLTLGLIDQHLVDTQQVGNLEQEWRLVHQAILYRQALAQDEILGQVRVTKSFKIPACSCITIPGFVKTTRGGYSLHAVAEPSKHATLPSGVSLAGEQYINLRQGSNRVGILLQNDTEQPVIITPRTVVCQLVLGNLVPKLVAPSSEFTEVDKHLLDDDLPSSGLPEDDSLDEEAMEYSQFKQTAAEHSHPSASKGLKSATVPTMSCTVGSGQDETAAEEENWLLKQIDISGALQFGEDFHAKAQKLFIQYQDTFSKTDMDLGKATSVKHNIILTDPIPFKERYRRIPPQLYDEVKAHLQDMLRLGAIRRSCSPWASAIVLVRKKNGKLRFCIDLRKLNSRTLKDSYALPRIEQTLESLADSSIYSTLDLTSGYWQVEMAEECKPYTAFTCGPLGFYECETMPFGATNAPATFQRLMEDCLGDLNMSWCIVYLDDVIVFSQTPEEHLKRLEAVFKKLKFAGLKLKPSKCTFFKKEITYLGHLITAEGVATDPSKVEVVKDWPVPKTVSEVRSFLGFVGYYRRFIQGFSAIAKTLYSLTKGLESQCKKVAKKTLVKWGDKEEKAFQELKDACISAPVLGYPDYTLPFILHTDSSTDGLGAVLYQEQSDGMRVIAYASRSLTASEANYAPHKLEFLALKWAVTDKFKEYLYGGNHFEVYTDNNPLTYILSSAKLDACGQRWVADLANFNFTLHYKPGSTNTVADALSRIVWPDVLSKEETEEFISMPANMIQLLCANVTSEPMIDSCAYSFSALPIQSHLPIERGWNKDDWTKLQSEDPILRIVIDGLKNKTFRHRTVKPTDSPTLKHYIRHQKQLQLLEGILYRKSYTGNHQTRTTHHQIVLPKALFNRVMTGCHDEVGHQGRDRTISLVRERFYWDTLYKDTCEYVANCPRCLRRKATQQTAPMQPIFATQPMEIIHLDHLSLEPCKGKYDSVLVVTDHYTRYAQAYAVPNQTAQTTARILWEQFLRHYGFPHKILTDQGPGFESDLFKELLKITTIEKLRTTSYHPQTNGQCERFNSTLMNMLGTMTPEQKKDWKAHLLTMCHAYNATQHASTGFSPYYLMFGRHPRLPIDYQLGISRDGLHDPIRSSFVKKLKQRLQVAFERANKLQQEEALRHKKRYDRRSRGVDLLPNDLVLVRKVAFTERHKIQDRWEEGEYLVIARPDPFLPVYKVQPVNGGKVRTLHRNLLLPLGLQLKSKVEENSSKDEGNRGTTSELLTEETIADPSAEKLNSSSADEASEPETTLHLDENEVVAISSQDSDSEDELVPYGNSDFSDIPTTPDGFKEFWELVERDEELYDLPWISDSPQDEEVIDDMPVDQGLENAYHPRGNSDSESDSDSHTQLPRRSKRVNKGKPPNRYGLSINCPHLGTIV